MAIVKPSIYDAATSPSVLEPSPPSKLEQIIGEVRSSVVGNSQVLAELATSTTKRVNDTETRLAHEVRTVWAPNEQLIPAALYVGIAGLSGSILVRSRGLFARALVPPILGLASFGYFLPQTTSNLHQRILLAEEAHAPQLARLHVGTLEAAHDLLGRGRKLLGSTDDLAEKIQDGRRLAWEKLGYGEKEGRSK